METINDVRREKGNPRHGEVGGPPRSVHGFFGRTSLWKAAAAIIFILAAVLICLGVFTDVFPIAIAGCAVLVLSVIVYFGARNLPVW